LPAKNLGALLVTVVAAVGCASSSDYARRSTVGTVGCPEQEIEIVGEPESNAADGRMTWEARCRGVSYFCSRGTNSGIVADTSSEGTRCTESRAEHEQPQPEPEPGG